MNFMQDFFIMPDKDLRLDFLLREKLPSELKTQISNGKIRRLIMAGCVKVNDFQTRNPSFVVKKNSKVSVLIDKEKLLSEKQTDDVKFEVTEKSVLYEDDYLIVVEKECGLLTVAAHPGATETTAFSILLDYVRRENRRNGIFVVHRLDRETSGLLVFSKKQDLQEYMRTYWRQIVTNRTYVAVANGIIEEDKNTIRSWLTEDPRSTMVYSSPTDNGGKLAITHYKVIRRSEEKNCSLVELHLETGRTNQIRVHLASIGHPVLSDRKYGLAEAPIDRLALHARILEFIHPVTEETLHFETPVPREFLHLFH